MDLKIAEHTSQEMAELILKIEDGIYKDRKAQQQWAKDIIKVRNENLLLQKMIDDGNTKIKLAPLPPEPEMFFTRQHRRKIRYRLFRIRDGGPLAVEHDLGLKAWIELQFKPSMNWKGFTFSWDVSPSEPLKVITPFQWLSDGGEIDEDTGLLIPSGFTNQE